MDLRAYVAGTGARVVPAIEVAMEAVPLRIIKLVPRLAVLARGHWLAGEQAGRPGAVVGLEPQCVVGAVYSQALQPARQFAAVDDFAGTVGRLPKAVDRHELLAPIAPPLGQLAGARIGLQCFSCAEPLRRE